MSKPTPGLKTMDEDFNFTRDGVALRLLEAMLKGGIRTGNREDFNQAYTLADALIQKQEERRESERKI